MSSKNEIGSEDKTSGMGPILEANWGFKKPIFDFKNKKHGVSKIVIEEEQTNKKGPKEKTIKANKNRPN